MKRDADRSSKPLEPGEHHRGHDRQRTAWNDRDPPHVLHGSWTYTRTLDRTARWLTETQGWPFGLEWGLFAAVLAGAALSAWQRRSFRLKWRPSGTWALHFAGGLLMGIGAALVPDGNEVLVLHALPQLSPHPLPAYLSMTGGVASRNPVEGSRRAHANAI